MERHTESLVVGADGFIGQALVDHLESAGKQVLETTRRIDTTSEKRYFLDLGEDVSKWRPTREVAVAYLCAAVASLDQCRRAPVQSAIVNVHHTLAVAETLLAHGAFVVFLSTNLVYDGSIPFRKASDSVCPVTEYGRQKAEAERQLLALGDSVSIVRFTKILGSDVPLFKGWVQALRNNNEVIHAFSDMVMAPVSLSLTVRVLEGVAQRRLSGILQVSGDQDITYEHAARYMAQRIGTGPDRIQPIRSADAGLRLEATPAHTTLDATRLRTELGIDPPSVWATIESGCARIAGMSLFLDQDK